jgi:hypothetical protein
MPEALRYRRIGLSTRGWVRCDKDKCTRKKGCSLSLGPRQPVVKHGVKFQVVDRREILGGRQFDNPQRFHAATMMLSVIQPLDR